MSVGFQLPSRWMQITMRCGDEDEVAIDLTDRALDRKLQRITRLLEEIVSNQEALDARVAEVQAVAAAIGTSVDGIQQAIDELKNQAPPELDFSGLDSAVESLKTAAADASSSDPGAPGIDLPPPVEPPVEPPTDPTE